VLFFSAIRSAIAVGSLWLGGNGFFYYLWQSITTVDILDTTGTTLQHNPLRMKYRIITVIHWINYGLLQVPSRELNLQIRARPIIGEHQSWKPNEFESQSNTTAPYRFIGRNVGAFMIPSVRAYSLVSANRLSSRHT